MMNMTPNLWPNLWPNLCGLLLAVLALPALAGPLDMFRDCETCPEMVELPLGEFVMGAPDDEFRRMLVQTEAFYTGNPDNPYKKEDEGPQQQVTVDIPIAMGRNEITYDEWMACVQDAGCNGYVPENRTLRSGPFTEFVAVDGDHPVLYISYPDALAYVDWLNEKIGSNGYRLPTEAEWEYAARAGTQTSFAQGRTLTSDQANFSKQATEFVMLELRPDLIERGHPLPVGELDAANAWGLHHMSGNAREITLSCYTERLEGWARTSQWLEAGMKDCPRRAIRGGSYASPIDSLRVAWRGPSDATARTKYNGFRVVKQLK